jgi:hypothetical protein
MFGTSTRQFLAIMAEPIKVPEKTAQRIREWYGEDGHTNQEPIPFRRSKRPILRARQLLRITVRAREPDGELVYEHEEPFRPKPPFPD